MNFRNTSPNIAIENLKMTVSSAPDGDEGIVDVYKRQASTCGACPSVGIWWGDLSIGRAVPSFGS